MFPRLFHKAEAPRTLPGERIYAIGDIHGRHDLLCRAFGRIAEHHAARPGQATLRVILLGDLVDRGNDSAAVVRDVRAMEARSPWLTVLSGNHEDMIRRLFEGETDLLKIWLQVGGLDTLESFGLAAPKEGETPNRTIERWSGTALGEAARWFATLPCSVRSGDYFFCHAGVRPGIKLSAQARDDLMWIRRDFTESRRDHGAVIVHGHDVLPEVEFHPNRIGIDTGAYCTDLLSVLFLEGEERDVLSITLAP